MSEQLLEFDDIVLAVLDHEGGYVDDPDDRGAETNLGISKRNHPDVDIRSLTIEKAKYIYRTDYWEPSKASEVRGDIRHMYFDMVVNHGQRNAVRILQRSCNKVAGIALKVDGVIGPKTLKASEKADRFYLVLERAVFYNRIVENDVTQSRFLHGWMNRCFSFT